jgi:hypothetical protein
MKFNREELRAAVGRAIEQHRQAHETRWEETHEEWTRARAAWVDEYGPAWLDALPKLRAKLRKGQPITQDDLPQHGRYHQVALFGDRQPRRIAYADPVHLLRLAAVLDACADPTVTSGGLTALGITRASLASAVACLRPASATTGPAPIERN